MSLIRENTTADKYGTICLPFAASVPSNATVYDVVGVNSKDAPSELYLQSVDALEAGKAYVFQSSDAEDITFTKTGTEDNLISPAAADNLIGQFSGSAYVPIDSYILSGNQWKKVVSASSNIVKNYRAYLTLTESLVVPASDVRADVIMDLSDGTATDIQTVHGEGFMVKDYYDMSGRRVAKPTKGMYIVNGKKILF